MEAPLITIGITCFNAEDTIGRAVLSALAQSWPNTQIVVVDDHSKDGSMAVLDGLRVQYPQLEVVHHTENRGYPSALNTIMAHARGEWVAIFDDDDVSDENRLTEQYNRICAYEERNGGARVLCYSNRNVVQSGAQEVDHVAEALGRHANEPYGQAVADYIFGMRRHPEYVWGVFGSCTMMARRQTFLEIGTFDEQFRRCAEWDYAIRGAFNDIHFISVNKPLITQFKTKTSEKGGKIPLQYDLKLREKYRDFLSSKRFYTASKLICRARFYGSKGRRTYSNFLMACAYVLAPALIVDRLKTSGAAKIG